MIGGGTAGSTIAARLAEDPKLSIALFEAGGFYENDDGNTSTVPGLISTAQFLETSVPFQTQPLVDWSLVSVPQPGAAGRKIHYPQGKTLGGSSALNSMAYHRSNVGAYQRWADTVGDQSFTFPNILPYFKKSCHLTAPDYAKRDAPNATVQYDPTAFEATGGPLQVSWSNWVDPALIWILKAFATIGLPINALNFNSGSLVGGSAWITSTIDPSNATRSSSQSSFLAQTVNQTNLRVYNNTIVQKILFKSNGTATNAVGVMAESRGQNLIFSARREVILSAGVFHSPQLLMVSGKTFLRKTQK